MASDSPESSNGSHYELRVTPVVSLGPSLGHHAYPSLTVNNLSSLPHTVVTIRLRPARTRDRSRLVKDIHWCFRTDGPQVAPSLLRVTTKEGEATLATANPVDRSPGESKLSRWCPAAQHVCPFGWP